MVRGFGKYFCWLWTSVHQNWYYCSMLRFFRFGYFQLTSDKFLFQNILLFCGFLFDGIFFFISIIYITNIKCVIFSSTMRPTFNI